MLQCFVCLHFVKFLLKIQNYQNTIKDRAPFFCKRYTKIVHTKKNIMLHIIAKNFQYSVVEFLIS